MDPFEVHRWSIADYSAFASGFTGILSPPIREPVEQRAAARGQWLGPYMSPNPKTVQLGGVLSCQGSVAVRSWMLIVALRLAVRWRPFAVLATYLEIARLTTRGLVRSRRAGSRWSRT